MNIVDEKVKSEVQTIMSEPNEPALQSVEEESNPLVDFLGDLLVFLGVAVSSVLFFFGLLSQDIHPNEIVNFIASDSFGNVSPFAFSALLVFSILGSLVKSLLRNQTIGDEWMSMWTPLRLLLWLSVLVPFKEMSVFQGLLLFCFDVAAGLV